MPKPGRCSTIAVHIGNTQSAKAKFPKIYGGKFRVKGHQLHEAALTALLHILILFDVEDTIPQLNAWRANLEKLRCAADSIARIDAHPLKGTIIRILKVSVMSLNIESSSKCHELTTMQGTRSMTIHVVQVTKTKDGIVQV